MPAVECPNAEINEGMCPCAETSCARHGICCECLAYHAASSTWPLSACMRGAQPEKTLMLSMKEDAERCAQYEKNLERCVCASDTCSYQGTCCDCVRNHWGNKKNSLVACMRGRD